MNKIIECKDINLTYKKNSEDVLQNINLNVYEGEMIAVIGPSGAGKSTLFKMFVRAIKPRSGEIKVFGKHISKISNKHWKKIIDRIGFLTQKPNLINTDNVYENIRRSHIKYSNFFFQIFGILNKKQKTKIFQTLDELNILDKAFSRVSDLSGGQQQRVEIAKLLIRDVDLILADEPTANLDNHTSKEVLDLLLNLKHKSKTLIVNIHDLSLIKQYFDRVIAINNKHIILNKKVEDVELWELIESVQKTQ
ncbi:ATP-binding cassette domain-containing protein [Mycoplasma sp. ES3157-GEN-MYC]|uniref:ATP-binding cassette domain-containing protein n=1 Tax=Mycoplasma miroungigenitalium TaxID=754515 RepID=A0A6M4JBC4_9MOLU|nr:ATP-binding cassette domain-containing protein [Mycoplasma miroungigenitalium]MBU4690290.1 ATP-binding cassette domain-containing protein [Mycoplasma miroungigenitalium]MBU4691557.1 ATP-binding cassette domain-containing protein [Mycoplasma miroungigenitalium]QJR43389.1 ATP-binding cassette domain-containing protein [Mycoplasma miroungigenitalium]